MRVGRELRLRCRRCVHGVRLLLATSWLAACGHDAWLGFQCPETDPGCDTGGSVPNSAADAAPTMDPSPASVEDAGAPPARGCRNVTMNFFACASAAEQPGIPRLLAGEPYTVRLRGDYALDTSFQLQGASTACMATALGPITLAAGTAVVERCITPAQDVALLITVGSGDPQVWVQGLMAEVCDGCP